MNAKEEFRQNWEAFTDNLKGAMLVMLSQADLSFDRIASALEARREFWNSRQLEGGRWLERYSSLVTEKADLVRKILTEDLKFSQEQERAGAGIALKVLRILVGFILGYVIAKTSPDSWLMRTDMLAEVRGAVPFGAATACAVAFYVLGLPFDRSLSEKRRRGMVESYLRQLDKYKKSVESILDE